ncbi:DEAD/DEAH box helicase [Actinosynnema mirum]|uniref:Non-specific serine/threonine protein kinase n=1 Tax=Actinosynnema mirum (strain ATCC 29888 / DSM 43827 / JCM 3225 / NBRC 14064 / NCIMB 13271 / NRRL B-12336 / IMRU 3971 / 101) TaxID=446462 RepID=C6WNT4_ACTMD|nr:Non-specific serine/threonine protein kinase [Actinosynnema mirum DSM 43827]
MPLRLVVQLPTAGTGPIASPELVGASGAAAAVRGTPRLHSWLVPAVRVEGLPERIVDGRLGASARFYLEVLAFADDLVARGRVVPGVDGGAARWRAVLSGVDAVRFAALRAGMPPSFRAAQESVEPDRLTRAALDRAVDRRVRDGDFSGVDLDEPGATGIWLRALVGNPVLGAASGAVARLRERVEHWQGSALRRPLLRTCFRLTAPDQSVADEDVSAGPGPGGDGGGRWELEFLVQAVDEPSVVVPAEQLWSRGNNVLRRFATRPEDVLLADLGRASRLYPALDRALGEQRPARLVLDVAGAHDFLVRANELSQAGFGVLVPSWWREPRRVGLALSVSGGGDGTGWGAAGQGAAGQGAAGLGGAGRGGAAGAVPKESSLGLKVLLDYRWSLALGDEELAEPELRALAEAKVPLVRLRGQWVQVDQRGLTAGLAFLRRGGGGRMTVGQALAHAGALTRPAGRNTHDENTGDENTDDENAGDKTMTSAANLDGANPRESNGNGSGGSDPDGLPHGWFGALPLPVTAVRGDGALGALLAGGGDRVLEEVAAPEGLTAVLRPYQARGLAWLAFLDSLGLGACLADDMGLGKTVQLLALEALCRQGDGGSRAPTLLVCPLSVLGNWQREAARFTPGLRVRVHHGPERDVSGIGEGCDLVLTTYAVVVRDVEALRGVRWDRVVLDEAQNVKNSSTRQFRAVRSLDARHRVALTGTPVENRLAELWSVMDFANPGVLGTVSTFRARFAVPVERHGDEDAAVRLRRVTAPFVLRRLKTDPRVISDLPDKIEVKQLCPLTPEQASLYQAVLDDMLAKVDGSEGQERRGLVLASLSKLKQVCNHPAQLLGDGSRVAGRSGKVNRLEEVLEEVLADGDKALCFTQFTEFGSLLAPHLSARFDTDVLFLHGGTPKRARDAMVERFQGEGGPSVFLLSLKAGGTGLNLTAANHVIHLDRWWNPAVEDQATDRAFRIGQRRHVQVRKFVCAGTVEERIDRMVEQKRGLARMVVGTGEDWITELSTGQLRELLSLTGEVFDE